MLVKNGLGNILKLKFGIQKQNISGAFLCVCLYLCQSLKSGLLKTQQLFLNPNMTSLNFKDSRYCCLVVINIP